MDAAVPTRRSEDVASTALTPPGALTIELLADEIFCDDTSRPVAVITNAEPGEPIAFTSPQPVEVPEVVADENGVHRFPWRCQPSEAALSWELTATGTASGRSATFRIDGSATDPSAEALLVYEPSPDGPVCDGRSRAAGVLFNAEPYEQIRFSSDDASEELRPGFADENGELDVSWSCTPSELDQSWRVVATASDSGRVGEFIITARSPSQVVDGPIEVLASADPLICDGLNGSVASLVNLRPLATVSFVADPPSGDLADGQASLDGDLPIRWRCKATEAATTWTVTATEEAVDDEEPRSVTFDVTGTAAPETVSVTQTESPFVCDGETRQFGVLSGFLANEYVDFESPQASGLRQGQADDTRTLPVRWQCEPDQVGTVWEVTATGQTSGFTLDFTITGAAP